MVDSLLACVWVHELYRSILITDRNPNAVCTACWRDAGRPIDGHVSVEKRHVSFRRNSFRTEIPRPNRFQRPLCGSHGRC